MTSNDWKSRLERFFYERAAGAAVEGVPTLYDHCLVSAKDPRISARPDFHAEMVASIVDALALEAKSQVLEVGCASGYVACGLAPLVGSYTGVDIASSPLEVARKIPLENAKFLRADGGALPFEDGEFDAAFMYDVYTNFPSFEDGVPLMREMLRVVRRGGRVMIGSVTDRRRASDFVKRVHEVAERLDAEHGKPQPPRMGRMSLARKVQDFILGKAPRRARAEIFVYHFDPEDFEKFARSRGVSISITDVHRKNPYFGFRYNVIFSRPIA